MAELVIGEEQHRTLHPTVFLDRDGVINDDSGWLTSPDELRIYPFAAAAISIFNRLGLITIVISNQSVIARELATPDEVDEIHRVLSQRLQLQGASIDGYYYCPHHPDFTGQCGCRKPLTGLIDRAVKEHNVDVSSSFMVGDSTGDILAGRRAGLTTILVQSGNGGRDGLFDVLPDVTSNDLLSAARYIVSVSRRPEIRQGEDTS